MAPSLQTRAANIKERLSRAWIQPDRLRIEPPQAKIKSKHKFNGLNEPPQPIRPNPGHFPLDAAQVTDQACPKFSLSRARNRDSIARDEG